MVCSTKLITLKRLMFSCWPLFDTEVVFSFFEMPFYLLVEVSVVFRVVCSTGVSCKCFSFFFISSCSSFIFRLCLSLFLMFEFDNFLEGIFSCLLYLLVGLSEGSFLYVWFVVVAGIVGFTYSPCWFYVSS